MELINTTTILEKTVNVYGTKEEPLFLAKDVSEWIEHSDTSMMLKNIDDDEKLIQTMLVSGQNREVWMLTENGLYEVLMQSRKPIAKVFKKGVKEMLKSVRKHGIYATPVTAEKILNDPDLMISLLQNLKSEREQKRQLQIENNKLDLKTQFVDVVFNSTKNLTLSQAAKLLKLPFGRNIMARQLREKGIFFQNSNEPKQTYIDRGYFMVYAFINEKMGSPKNQTVVTQKGLPFLAKIFNVIIPSKNIVKSL